MCKLAHNPQLLRYRLYRGAKLDVLRHRERFPNDGSDVRYIGQTVMAFGSRVDYFINTVFNYPTLAECYKTAAFDGVNRLI